MKYLKIKDSVDLNVLIEKYGFHPRTIQEWGKTVKQFVFKGQDSERDVVLVVDVSEQPEITSNYRIIKYIMTSSWIRRPIPAVLLRMIKDDVLEEIDLDF